MRHYPYLFGGTLVWRLAGGRTVTLFGTNGATGGWFMQFLYDFGLLVPCLSQAAMRRLVRICRCIGWDGISEPRCGGVPPMFPLLRLTRSLHTKDSDPPNSFSARDGTHSSVESLATAHLHRRKTAQTFRLRPSGTLGEPHEVTAPSLSFVSCARTSCFPLHYSAQRSNPTGRR